MGNAAVSARYRARKRGEDVPLLKRVGIRQTDVEYQRRYREAHPVRIRRNQRISRLVTKCGMSREAAIAAVEVPPVSCEICGRQFPLHCDHDHASLQHRGWLCNYCNTRLPILEDTEWLNRAQAYLQKGAHHVPEHPPHPEPRDRRGHRRSDRHPGAVLR